MTTSPGARLGPYEILAPLGAGGMGEVFRGRDTRLDRSVAIKILSGEVAGDPELRQRFQVEARAVSSLNHPHICTLHDVGEQDGVEFIVMELLTGQTLADRLLRGPLPLDHLLRTAIEIASALDAAHANGITHRDLKPSNVMLTKAGAKLLDFGIAKLRQPATAGALTRTLDPALTGKGAILGTFPYMAPEQIEGKDSDARVDIFALGAVLYEMAAGRKAFDGQTQASLTAAILEREPLPLADPRIPPALDHVIRRCLAKDPDQRWQSARDVLFELKWIAEPGVEKLAAAGTHRRREVWAWSVAAAAALVAAGTIAVYRQAPAADAPVQLEVALPEGVTIPPLELRTNVSMSPDGRHLAFIAIRDGVSRVWLRSLDTLAARALPGTEGAIAVFWSPDSRFVGFGGSGKLQRIDLAGGPSHLISDAEFETVPAWGRDGTILFDQNAAGRAGIFRVPASGGPVTQVTAVDRERNEREHFWPSFLPDGIHFFYVVGSLRPDTGAFTRTVYVASLDSPGATKVLDVDSRMTYAAPGHVLYAQDGALMARRFDLKRFQLAGDPVRLADRLSYFRPTGLAEFSASDSGALAFRERTSLSELVWVDRSGKQLETVGARAAFGSLRLSPDGRKIAVDVIDPRSGSGDLWIYDRETGIPTPFTSDPREAIRPIWSGDGLHLFFRSGRDGPPDIYEKRTDGRGSMEPVIELAGVQVPEDVSRDGRHLVYKQANRTTMGDLWVLPLVGPRTPRLYLATKAHDTGARFSPDGRWLAFVSAESGSPEVYVAPLDEPGARQRISLKGGVGPRWVGDGTEIFYFSLDNTLMVVPVGRGPEVRPGVPRPLFTPGPILRLTGGSFEDPAYDVSADGQRFLVNRLIEDAALAPIMVVLNWPALLRK